MNRLMHTTTAALLSATLAGCASDGTMDDETRTKTEGSAVGALLGAALGYAIGGKKGAVIGGVVGAGAGYAVGDEIARRKKQYANQEDFLDGEIQYVAEYNRNATEYNARLARHIEQTKQEVARLQRRYKAGQAKRAELLARRKQVQQKLAKSKQMLADMQKEYEVNKEILAEQRNGDAGKNDPSLVRLEKEVATLKANIERLQQGTEQLAAIDERLSV